MAEPSVLVVGALHYDVVVRAARLPVLDETLDGQSVAYVFGGKGGNQAVAAARHGAPTAMAGRVGADAPGRFMIDHLDRLGVDHSMVLLDDTADTGMSVAVVTATGEYGAVIVSGANRSITVDEITLPPGLGVVLLQNEIPAAVNASIARRAHQKGAAILHNAAPMRPADAALDELIDVLIVNRIEAASFAGHSLRDVAETMQVLADLADDRRTVLITLGADGLAYRQPRTPPRHLPAFPVSVQSSHGAGDAFCGALAAQLAQDALLEPALRYAQAAAALHVSTSGLARDALSPAAVRRFLERQKS